MRTAETVLNIIRERALPFTLRLLESDVIRKRSCVVWRGAIEKVLAMVTRWSPTLLSCPVLETSRWSNLPAEFNSSLSANSPPAWHSQRVFPGHSDPHQVFPIHQLAASD
ncbi:hypothetical protein HC928_15685 [bacterium]|nr:hypothetical protein [bacterium]